MSGVDVYKLHQSRDYDLRVCNQVIVHGRVTADSARFFDEPETEPEPEPETCIFDF